MEKLKRFWKLGIDLDTFINKYDKEIGTFLFERYKDNSSTMILRTYYVLKSLIPRRLQILLRRRRAKSVRSSFPHWPIEEKLENLKRDIFESSIRTSDEIPFIWFWPHGKAFAFVITHDVETQKGPGNIERVCEIERKYGFRSSWNFVPERYSVDARVLDGLVTFGAVDELVKPMFLWIKGKTVSAATATDQLKRGHGYISLRARLARDLTVTRPITVPRIDTSLPIALAIMSANSKSIRWKIREKPTILGLPARIRARIAPFNDWW